MAAHIVPTNQATCWFIWRNAVVAAAGVTAAQASECELHLDRAFTAGEPIWMAAEELALRAQQTGLCKTIKPSSVATSYIRDNVRIKSGMENWTTKALRDGLKIRETAFQLNQNDARLEWEIYVIRQILSER